MSSFVSSHTWAVPLSVSNVIAGHSICVRQKVINHHQALITANLSCMSSDSKSARLLWIQMNLSTAMEFSVSRNFWPAGKFLCTILWDHVPKDIYIVSHRVSCGNRFSLVNFITLPCLCFLRSASSIVIKLLLTSHHIPQLVCDDVFFPSNSSLKKLAADPSHVLSLASKAWLP